MLSSGHGRVRRQQQNGYENTTTSAAISMFRQYRWLRGARFTLKLQAQQYRSRISDMLTVADRGELFRSAA